MNGEIQIAILIVVLFLISAFAGLMLAGPFLWG